MKEQEFNPVIIAVVSIRELAKILRGNWSDMIKNGKTIETSLKHLNRLVASYGTEETIRIWNVEMVTYTSNLEALKTIMNSVQAQVKRKNSDGIVEKWSAYTDHVTSIETTFDKLKAIGKRSLPEVEVENWNIDWTTIETTHDIIKKEAEACLLHLQLIEKYTPSEIDELSTTILKYIPMNYSQSEAKQYTSEYMEAYEAIKKEASQKKNLWDRFLDILAGGIQQTPAERVMMQRWVEGEKGEAH